MSPKENTTNVFDGRMYGALLRHKRMEVGYRKAEQFISDLEEVGYKISKAALYRIERGEQEPPLGFLLAANIVLYGNAKSFDLINPCVPQEWLEPFEQDDILRVLKQNGVIDRYKPDGEMNLDDRAARYDSIMSGFNSYDFVVFPNGSCTENELYITIATGTMGAVNADSESFQIESEEDIERAVIAYLKAEDYFLPGEEIVKLVDYAKRKTLPTLKEYMEGWNHEKSES